MLEFTVTKNEDGKRLDRVLLSRHSINRNTVFKALRNKDIKVNSKRVSDNIVLNTDDIVTIYINVVADIKQEIYKLVYCDDDKIIISKMQGVSCDKDKYDEETIIDAIRDLYGMDCMLCHRIDRNTGGLLLIARNEQMRISLVDMLENKDISKKYTCMVYGKINATEDYIESKAYHFKDKSKSLVYISDEKKKYYKEIVTKYKLIKYDDAYCTSLLEVVIDTGRTHQIRAHMAHLGYPVVGDGKYGINDVNRKFPYKYQVLWASEMCFNKDLILKDDPIFR